ncbi:MAG: MFS transporter [Candidatus Eremiobacteraeota bacterium]|nr:MFS transporter [Candidatus Eremiobacteraeota bacterium]MBV8498956.1 MFS transporter [Candidatus Eremiobacteraeota bacterium]
MPLQLIAGRHDGSFAVIPRRNPPPMKARTRNPRPHNPLPESPYEVLALFTGAMAGASLWIMSTGALMPFFTAELHVGQTQLGLILSIQLVGSVAMTSVAGLLTDRFGDKAVVLWSGAVMGLALIAASLAENYRWLICWLLIYGIGYAAVTPAGSHAIIFFFRKADRGFAMGVRQCGVPIAGALGSVVLPAIALHFRYTGALAAAGLFTVATCSIASLLYREPRELAGERVSVRAMLADMLTIAREAPLIFLTLNAMVLICAQFALMGFFTLTLVHSAGYSLALAVALFTLAQFAAIFGRLSWGWMSDRFFGASRALPLALVCVLVALVAFGVASISPATPLWLAAAIAAALGFAAEGWLGLSIIGFAEIGGEERCGSALGVGLTWTLFAGFVTPVIFGALVQALGFPAAWRALAAFELVGVVPALLASAMVSRAIAAHSSS